MPEQGDELTVQRDVQLPDIPLTDEDLRKWIEKKKEEEQAQPSS